MSSRLIEGVIHLPDGQRIMTCSRDGSLRVWNMENGKQIGDDWRDVDDSEVWTIALSPDRKKVVSGSDDGVVKLWDIEMGKVTAKWKGHTEVIQSLCWSEDGQQVLSGSNDGTARQWDVESGRTILGPIETGHEYVWAVLYSPESTMFATAGFDESCTVEDRECSIKIWDAKTGQLVTTLKGHTNTVTCLAWTPDGKMLISGSVDDSIRTWNTTTWKQTAILDAHTSAVYDIAISPNGRILASASFDSTARLWNLGLNNGQPISSHLHQLALHSVSFSEDGKSIFTGCEDNNAYTWDFATIVREACLDDLLSDPKDKKLLLDDDATRRPVQRRRPAHRAPPVFFNVPPDRSHFSAPSRLRSSALQGNTLLDRLFHRSPSDAHNDTSASSPLGWTRNLLKLGRSGEGIELHGRSSAVVEVPYAKGKRRNASARAKWRPITLPSKNSTAGSSRPPQPNVTQQSGTATEVQPSSQPQPAVSPSPTTPVAATSAATTSTISRPDITIRQAGCWTRFWLFIGCLPHEYTDNH